MDRLRILDFGLRIGRAKRIAGKENIEYRIFEQISIAEKGHAKLIYRFCQKFKPNPPPFDKLYDSLKGEVLEGGQNFEDACHNLDEVTTNSCSGILDFALTI